MAWMYVCLAVYLESVTYSNPTLTSEWSEREKRVSSILALASVIVKL